MSTRMKFLSISGAITALLLGMQLGGLVNLQQIPNDIGLSEHIETRYVIVGLDITLGREDELQKDFVAIQKLLKKINLGDKLEMFLIHSRSESEQEAICSIEMPNKPGPMGLELSRAKKGAEQAFSNCWDEKVKPLIGSNKYVQRTDLFGFLRFVSQRAEFRKHENPILILLTDGQQVGDGLNFEKVIPNEADLTKVIDNNLLPNLSGIKVLIAGFTPTHNVSNAHWRKLQAWWREYLKTAGAEVVSIASERNLQQIMKK